MVGTRTSAPWIGKRAAWRWMAAAVVLTLLASVAAWLAARSWGESELERELAEMKRSGAPTRLRELPTPAGRTGSDWRKWVQGIHAIESSQPVPGTRPASALFVLGYATATTSVSLGPTDDFRVNPPCAAVLASVSGDADAFWEHVRGALADPVLAEGERDCLLKAFERRAQESLQQVELGLTAPQVAHVTPTGAGGSFDGTRFAEILDMYGAVGCLTDPLQSLARARALAGNASECITAIEAGLAAAGTVENVPCLDVWMRWIELDSAFLACAAECVSWLPPETDFSSWNGAAESLEPQARCLAAIDGSRALALEQHACAKAGVPTGVTVFDEQVAGLGPLASFALDKDLAEYLAATRIYAELARLSPAEAAARFASFPPIAAPTFGSMLASVAPRWSSHPWAGLEARRRLLQLAILARTRGADEAIAACERLRDPFDDAPMRSRRDSDELVTLWSIGFDGVDDRGRRPSLGGSMGDLVVSVLLH